MPKRIAHLEETILREARRLFEEKGYDQVDIREIAQAAGTAAGNLYNYYPSKQELFFKTAEMWHRELQEDLQSITVKEKGNREQLRLLLEFVYSHVSSRHGVWREFIESREKGRKTRFSRLQRVMQASEQETLQMVIRLLRKIQEEAGSRPLQEFEEYWARSLISAAALMPMSEDSREETNRQFLSHFLEIILPKPPPNKEDSL